MLHTRHLDLCEVPVAPSQYTLTDAEREDLYQGLLEEEHEEEEGEEEEGGEE